MNFKKLLGNYDSSLNDILAEIKNYNVYDFLSKTAALNLLPCNQSKCIVFDTIINAVLQEKSSSFKNQNIISNKKFKDIINKSMRLPIAQHIDPAEMPFIHKVFFHGNKWIFSGINTDIGYNLQNFIDILFATPNSLNETFIFKCRKMTNFILEISTNIAEQLGYNIDSLEHPHKKEVDFPDVTKMVDLLNAITIDVSQIEELLSYTFSESIFSNFEIEDLNNANEETNFSFYYSPFLKINDSTAIILNPAMLSTFLVHYIMKTAKEFNVLDDVIALYSNQSWFKCKKYLLNLGHKKIKEDALGIELIDSVSYKELLLSVSNDGLLFVRYFSDDGKDYDPNKMFKLYPIDVSHIEDRWKYLEKKISEHNLNRVYQIIIVNTFCRGVQVGFFTEQCKKTIFLSPFELMCVSINERNHLNFIARYVESKLNCQKQLLPFNSDIYNISVYSNNDYSFYFDDDVDTRTVRLFPGYSDYIKYASKALKKENRTLVEFPNSNYFKEVVIDDNIRNIYCSTTSKSLELLNRFSNVDIWITSDVATSIQALDITHSILDLISYWLSELKPVIEETIFDYNSIEINVVLEGDVNDYYCINNKSDKSLNDFFVFEIVDTTLKMHWSPEAFFNLDAEDNSRERELIFLILNQLSFFTSKPFDNNKALSVFSNPLKKKMYSLDYDTSPYFKPTDNNFRTIPRECEEELLNEIGYYFLKEKGFNYGKIEDEKKSQICKEIVDYLFEKLVDIVSQFDANDLIKYAYDDLEKIVYSTVLKEKRFAFDLNCYPEYSLKLAEEYNDLNKSSIAFKFLLEYTAACQPSGNKFLGELDYEYMLTICSLIVEWAHSSDLFYYSIINSDMNLLKSGRIGIDKTQINKLALANSHANIKRLQQYSNPFVEKFSQNNLLSETPNEIEEAFQEEYGYSFTEFVSCVFSLINIGETIKFDIKRMSLDEVCKCIMEDITIEKAQVIKIIDDISLKKRDNYLNPPAPYKSLDVFPWRFNRPLSFNRRPIIYFENEILWGNRQLYHTLLFTVDLIYNGKLNARHKKLKTLIGTISNKRGNAFNDIVAKKIESFELFIVDSKVEKINGQKLTYAKNLTLGDIDVLLINPQKKKIIVAEVKDFSFSKTPYEMQQEYLKVFCDSEDNLCYISKHKRRVEWIKEHINDVIVHYNLPSGKWKVDDVLIVNKEIISNKYFHKNQKTLLFTDITKHTLSKL